MSEPELILTSANRQRLFRHLRRLEAEAALAEHPRGLRPPTHPPTTTTTTTTPARPQPARKEQP